VKLDRVLANVPAGRAGAEAAAAEAAGLDGVWSTEAATDSLLTSMAAIRRTSRISVGTSIAVAFQRNPMSLAYAAWDLAAASQGRFQLGLGAATAEQVQDRFGMPFSHPIERMRDTVEALRAIWHTWRTGDRLAYDGRFHRHDLMTPCSPRTTMTIPSRSCWPPWAPACWNWPARSLTASSCIR
jgi:alkanesulfonate monooxygenase SsuD/methylene tetrahydromethanopterin reductase-like flavin-dependent oxidoreductase (luciferase family)